MLIGGNGMAHLLAAGQDAFALQEGQDLPGAAFPARHMNHDPLCVWRHPSHSLPRIDRPVDYIMFPRNMPPPGQKSLFFAGAGRDARVFSEMEHHQDAKEGG